MKEEVVRARRGTNLRKNNSQYLKIYLNQKNLKNIFLINGTSFIARDVSLSNLIVKPYDFYMIINNGKEAIKILYDQDVSNHINIYDPYKYENSEK